MGKFFSQYGLPYITGYLLTGMLAGPFILGMLPQGATDELRFVDDISLAVIAFVAGSELYLREIRDRIRNILLNISGIVVAALILLSLAIYALTYVIPFTADFTVPARVAMALLGATVLLALSPASTIAVMQEVRARGVYSKTMLSITVVMDVVIIVLFAISAAVADLLINNNAADGTFLVFLTLDLLFAGAGGVLTGYLLRTVLATSMRSTVKTISVLTIGALIFALSFWIDGLKLGVHLEPLLIAMIAGFYVTNFTNHRDDFESILHRVSPIIYVAFFTLTGLALKLDILLATGAVAVVLFGVRVFAIFIGTNIGGFISGEDPHIRRYAWAGIITQAGIALGLAREVAVEFPVTLGDAFATLVVSVIVLNEIFGPLFLKFALRRVGESHEPATPEPDEERNAVLFGIEGQSLALARQLVAHGWSVSFVDTQANNSLIGDDEGWQITIIDDVTPELLGGCMDKTTDAVVAMLLDDALNERICDIAIEACGIQRIIVRLHEPSNRQRFDALNVQIIDPTTAMVNLFDQYVRAPQSAALFMHDDPNHDIVQITVTEDDVHGMLLRELRLPVDVLVLEIIRHGQVIVPSGATRLQRGDEIVLLGDPTNLRDVTFKLGY
jgi:Trk K+ transport system NAD-binding subunit/Kef-type K+ transport system membrane component KefB